jgi:hypothetical protein
MEHIFVAGRENRKAEQRVPARSQSGGKGLRARGVRSGLGPTLQDTVELEREKRVNNYTDVR